MKVEGQAISLGVDENAEKEYCRLMFVAEGERKVRGAYCHPSDTSIKKILYSVDNWGTKFYFKGKAKEWGDNIDITEITEINPLLKEVDDLHFENGI